MMTKSNAFAASFSNTRWPTWEALVRLAPNFEGVKTSVFGHMLAYLCSSWRIPLHYNPKPKMSSYGRESYVALEALHQIHCTQLQGLFNDFSKQATTMLEAQANDRKFLVEVTELNLRSNVKSLYTICKAIRGTGDEMEGQDGSEEAKIQPTSKRHAKEDTMRAKRKLRVEVCDAYYGFVSRRPSLPPADRLGDKELVQLVLSNLPLFKRKRQKVTKSSEKDNDKDKSVTTE